MWIARKKGNLFTFLGGSSHLRQTIQQQFSETSLELCESPTTLVDIDTDERPVTLYIMRPDPSTTTTLSTNGSQWMDQCRELTNILVDNCN